MIENPKQKTLWPSCFHTKRPTWYLFWPPDGDNLVDFLR